ncbi:MAG TPA: isoprenylcysteine carboxylmethyltransferase family protein [Candidatus Sulfotelmatobacter sp.]
MFPDDLRPRILIVVQLIAAMALLWLVATYKTPWTAERYVGSALMIIGIGLIATARYQLGSSFSVKPEARKLITHGVYSKIRNPIYLAGLIMILGLILIVQKPGLWIALVIVLLLQIVRARREGAVLEAAFGDEYREYRRRTWI